MRYIGIILLVLWGCAQVPPVQVVDGDTVKVQGENVRLMGFDTPEIFRPKCAREKALGKEASLYLWQLLRQADDTKLVLERKSDGTARRDKYQRLLGRLYVNGIDVGALQIRAGFARPYSGGKRKGWCGYSIFRKS